MHRLSHQRLRGITDNGDAGGHVLCHNRAKPNCRAISDDDGAIWRAIFYESAGADVDVIADMHVAVHADARAEGHEITNDAIVADVALKIAVEVLAENGPLVGGEYGKITNHAAIGKRDPRVSDNGVSHNRVKAGTPFGHPTPSLPATNGQDAAVIGGNVSGPYDWQAEKLLGAVRVVIGEDGAVPTQSLGVAEDMAAHLPPEASGSVNDDPAHPRNLRLFRPIRKGGVA